MRCRRELARCGARGSPAAVHDARVAIRRLLALIDVLGSLPDAPRVEKARRRLRSALRRFGPLRDAQVLLDQVETLLPGSPDLARFRLDLRRKEARRRAVARRALRAKRIARLTRRFDRIAKRLRESDGDAIARTLARATDAARARVTDRRRTLDADRPETLHRLRIAFKRFRYLLEVADAAAGRDAPSRDRAMDEIQTVLGEILDLAVAERRLAAWGRKHGASLQAALDSLRRRRGQVAEDFLRRADEVLAFWPPAGGRRDDAS
jgi:CHAD domain-containing protein